MMETRDIVYGSNPQLQQLKEWADFARQAGIVPRDLNPYQVMTIIEAGREVGIPPLQALRSISIINGRVVMSVQLQLALARAKGVRVVALTETEGACDVTLKRGEETVSTRYTLEDARKAGLIRNGSSWEKYPRQMLRWRAIGDGLRIIAPDATAGFLSPEEAESIPPIDAEVLYEALPEPTHEPEPEPAPRPQRRRRENGNGGDTEANALKAEIRELCEKAGYQAQAFREFLLERYGVRALGDLSIEQLREVKATLESDPILNAS
ncbi:MAG: hypothetical protein CFK49_10770 [Armatimonadetes bacterium JP3_11]|nr:MAG: hypothetical protein CFK49_10770 [Armatimonadetes bacterium JP3_11]